MVDRTAWVTCPVFTAEKDEDFVLTYGLRGEQVTYYVRYVNAGGNDLRAASGPFYANSGDKVYVAFIEVSGYEPDAYNKTRTLTEDYTFIFRYSASSTNSGATSGGGSSTVVSTVGSVSTGNNNTVTGSTASGSAAGTGSDSGNTGIAEAENGTRPLDIIDEDALPQAGPEGEQTPVTQKPASQRQSAEQKRLRRLGTAAAVLGLLLIALLYWYLLFYRKKKMAEAEAAELSSAAERTGEDTAHDSE